MWFKKYRRTERVAKNYYKLAKRAEANGWNYKDVICFYNKSTKYIILCTSALIKVANVFIIITIILQAITFIIKLTH